MWEGWAREACRGLLFYALGAATVSAHGGGVGSQAEFLRGWHADRAQGYSLVHIILSAII